MMFIIAYDTDRVILHHAVHPRQTVNAAYYCTFLQHHLRPALRRILRHLMVQNPIIFHEKARNYTAAAVMDLLRRWQWEILEHPPYSPDMSPFDYNLFAKVKEPLRGTQYNTRDEFIHAIGWSIWNHEKYGCTDGVQFLPNIWKKVINMGTIIFKVHKCGTTMNKASQKYLIFVITFYPVLVIKNMVILPCFLPGVTWAAFPSVIHFNTTGIHISSPYKN